MVHSQQDKDNDFSFTYKSQIQSFFIDSFRELFPISCRAQKIHRSKVRFPSKREQSSK